PRGTPEGFPRGTRSSFLVVRRRCGVQGTLRCFMELLVEGFRGRTLPTLRLRSVVVPCDLLSPLPTSAPPFGPALLGFLQDRAEGGNDGQGQQGRAHQPADGHDRQGLGDQHAAGTEAERDGGERTDGRDGGHDDGPYAQASTLDHRFGNGQTTPAVLIDQVDQHDGVGDDDTDQHQKADSARDTHRGSGQQQRHDRPGESEGDRGEQHERLADALELRNHEQETNDQRHREGEQQVVLCLVQLLRLPGDLGGHLWRKIEPGECAVDLSGDLAESGRRHLGLYGHTAFTTVADDFGGTVLLLDNGDL